MDCKVADSLTISAKPPMHCHDTVIGATLAYQFAMDKPYLFDDDEVYLPSARAECEYAV